MKRTLTEQREAEEAARNRGRCDTCGKNLSRNQTLVFQVDLALCLDCALSTLGLADDDRVEISADLLRRLRDGILSRASLGETPAYPARRDSSRRASGRKPGLWAVLYASR